MLKERDVIAGRYRLESPIGEGAMGAVWRAEDQTLKRQVAIKFLFVKGSRDPQGMVDQFLREARIAASVQHRNVIHTVDFGTVDDFQPFMVMELLSGESLGDRMARKPPLSSEQLIHIVSLTLRGLSAVHDAGIVHRDLKPHNVFLQRDADAVYPKILDFGISRSLNGGAERPSAIATQEGLIIGTPDYMSPEQARGELNIDRRADIYSMGAIIFEGLTGRLPFVAETIGDLIVQIVTTQAPRVIDVAPHVPKPLSDLVAQAMSKNRDNRFADARAMRRALLAAAEAAWSRGGRIAASVPPAPVQGGSGLLTMPKAPSAAQQSAWGDFEGMEAPRIRDNHPPPAPLEPAVVPAAKPQRVVAHADDPRLDLPPPTAPDEPNVGPPAARARAKGRTRSATAAQREAELLSPMYSGGDESSLDLDYGKIKAAPKVARERPNAAARARALPREDTRGGLGRWLLWLVPVAVLAAGAYVLYGPQEIGAEAIGAIEPGGSEEAQVPGASRARRENPGAAAPHMRDVVF